MRLQIFSDIHAEFHEEFTKRFVEEYLDPKGVDVLIVAGDLSAGKPLYYSLKSLSECYAHAQILYVFGNHEYYAGLEYSIDFTSMISNLPGHLPVNLFKVIMGHQPFTDPLLIGHNKDMAKYPAQ